MTSDCTTKVCSRCKQDKPVSDFSKHRGHRDGLNSQCKACNAVCDASYRADHKDQLTAYRAANKYKIAERNAAWHTQHKDRQAAWHVVYHAKHRQEINARHAAHQRSNPIQTRAKSHRRRARKLAAGGTHTAADIQRQGEVQKWRCWWCGDDCKDRHHVDHLVPLSRGGHNGPGNIVIACPHCNLSKKDRLPDEWNGRLL